MLLEIRDVLNADELAHFQEQLSQAPWADGRITAGYQSALAKNNEQLPQECATARALSAELVRILQQNLLFQAASLPAEIFPPLFNRYQGGHAFGAHIDNALRPIPHSGKFLRTDLSATLFLSAPESYEGGALVIEDLYGPQSVKLQAGSMILYPATSLHHVTPVTKGTRVASFFWVQSLVRDAQQRAILFDLDMSIQALRPKVGDSDASLITLTGCYHNLLRQWAQG